MRAIVSENCTKKSENKKNEIFKDDLGTIESECFVEALVDVLLETNLKKLYNVALLISLADNDNRTLADDLTIDFV